jgi:LuxR family quorum sensing-dependent transcriptional regulator
MLELGEKLGGAETPGEVVAILTRWSARRGLPHVAIGHIPPSAADQPPSFFYSNWPPAWEEVYRAFALVREDPVVTRAQRDPTPFSWADIRDILTGWRLPGDGLSLLEAARGFGWTNGYVIPVHGLDGAVGIVSFAGTAPLQAPEERLTIQTGAMIAYLRLMTLHGRKPAAGTGLLTQRERSVLACVAQGMEDAEIGEALDITERTVRAHVQNARAKLGAKNRIQAVAEAMVRGLLAP